MTTAATPTTGARAATSTVTGSSTTTPGSSTSGSGTQTQGSVTILATTSGGGQLNSTTVASTAAATAGPTAKIAAATSEVVSDVRIYVEANGSDAATGATQTVGAADGPVLTLARAQALARVKLAAMLAGSATRLPVRVLIGPGTYPLSSTLGFNSSDSGTTAAPVSYEARQVGTVTISGGKSLGTQTAPSTVTALSFNAPVDAAVIPGGSQLYVNGRRAILARQPNAGSAWFVQRPIVLATDPIDNQGSEAFAPAAADLTWMANLSAADKARAIVDVMHSWTSSRHHLYTLGTPTGAVRVTPRSLWPFQNFGVSQRYFVENVVAALDAPGEWIYESGVIRYIRQADEAGQSVTPTLPLLEKLFLIQGESNTKQVQNLRFIGLSFAHTRFLTPATGFVDHQSAVELGAAIEVNKARAIVFDQCQVSQTAAWGIWLRDSVRESKVSNSTFTNTGAGGIRVGLTSQSPSDTYASGANQINGNNVSETGKVFPGAAAIWLGQTWDNQVQWNNVYRTTYTGISVGWTWGYADAGSGRNKINGNLLYNIGQGQMADLGGIYTLGKSPGTTITNNVIREVRHYGGNGGGGWGLYNDQGSSGIIMQTNVVVGTDSGGYFLQYGRDNTLHNNVFVASDAPDVNVGRLDTATNLTVRANLFVSNKPQVFGNLAKAPEVAASINEVSSNLSTTVDNSICGTGCTTSKTAITTTSAPLSVSSNSATWTPVINTALGIKGTTAALAVLALPAPALPAVIGKELLAPALVATGLEWTLDIAGTTAGSRPSTGFTYILGNDPNSIKVINKADAPGGKCLAYYDNATFQNTYEPMAYAKLNHTTGITTVEFSLQIDAATSFWHEWRDDGSPYEGGPTMFISSKGVQVRGTTVASVDVGQWIKFKVTAPMAQPSGVWKLEMTRTNGEKVTVNNLAMKTANFKRLNWLGFISNGVTPASSCLAGLKASNL
ncbi:right-handed parallel beta-helix repeat-containing protein [Roseateles sp. P5_E1]